MDVPELGIDYVVSGEEGGRMDVPELGVLTREPVRDARPGLAPGSQKCMGGHLQ